MDVSKNIIRTFHLLMSILLLSSCFVVDASLMNYLVSSKWVFFNGVAILIGFYLAIDLLCKRKAINVHKVDLVIGFGGLFVIVRDFVSPLASNEHFIAIVSGVLLLLGMRRIFSWVENVIQTIFVVYLLVILVAGLQGLLQLYGIISSNHSLFLVTGSFHNPGPFSGFIMSGFPIALGLYLSNRSTKHYWEIQIIHISRFEYELPFQVRIPNKSALLCYFSQLVLGLLFLVLPVARSRASWLGVVIGSLYVLRFFRNDFSTLEKLVVFYNNATKWWRLNFIAISVCVLCLGFLGIYKLKQGSADGRMLIWQVSWEMIKDKPLLGWGAGGFEAKYGNYQAEWFRSGKGTGEQEMFAGMPDVPFNELIRIAVAYGAIGISLSFTFLILLFRKEGSGKSQSKFTSVEKNAVFIKGALLSILCFSLFSYPIDVAPIVVQFLILCALLIHLKSNEKNAVEESMLTGIQFWVNKLLALVLFALLPILGSFIWQQYRGYQHWREAYQLYQFQIYDDASEEYQKASNCLPNNGLLLQMYGKCLCMGKQYSEAKNVLKQARLYRSDPILYTALGDAYKALKKYDKAEKAYLQAWCIIPHKFYPKYLLAKLYVEKGENDKARDIAKELLSKDVKVESKAIEEIRNELNKMLDKE
ncbi:hypothetical protein BZG01_10845 [Labilibaculum manganireducens]|uniref:O-antigen ligase-related domain-containing protein n=1 Tax=Labilibaculum manganireducens TaxID=1940525 RepID=A0A2N3I892_9BACT|nr:O-antigen ligase family protein [Labilibaculum manganireducens]PKQ66515.1 hypothetical protein BZG01_10845 [Labilibaculum manganireducens]